jgi:hypothetical protein
MQFFIAAGALLVVSTANLLYQFWDRAFVSDGTALDAPADGDTGAESLKAA